MRTNLASRVQTAVRLCFTDGVPRRSLAVALVVGTILNLINQADALFGTRAFSPLKAALTYLVPYCVATYGAVSYRLAMHRAGHIHAATCRHARDGEISGGPTGAPNLAKDEHT